jgi:uncharacterized protein YndB with AHSA1/START domain
MTEPTGRIRRTEAGLDLTLRRCFSAPIEDVWRNVTDPALTAQWFGPWRGECRPGGRIVATLSVEDGSPTVHLRVVECEAPHRLRVVMQDGHGAWDLELVLARDGAGTELELVHHLQAKQGIGEIGPGWEFYLDRLAASRVDGPLPDFADYYPRMEGYYEAL